MPVATYLPPGFTVFLKDATQRSSIIPGIIVRHLDSNRRRAVIATFGPLGRIRIWSGIHYGAPVRPPVTRANPTPRLPYKMYYDEFGTSTTPSLGAAVAYQRYDATAQSFDIRAARIVRVIEPETAWSNVDLLVMDPLPRLVRNVAATAPLDTWHYSGFNSYGVSASAYYVSPANDQGQPAIVTRLVPPTPATPGTVPMPYFSYYPPQMTLTYPEVDRSVALAAAGLLVFGASGVRAVGHTGTAVRAGTEGMETPGDPYYIRLAF